MWNHPKSEGTGSGRREPAKQSGGSFAVRGLLAGLIVVALGGAVVWLVFSPAETQQEAKGAKHEKRIKEVKPAAVPKVEAEKPEPPKPRGPQKVGESRDGWIKLPNGRLIKDTGAIQCGPARLSLEDKVFDHSTDRSIANLMTVEPGDVFVGDSSMYYKNFTERFLESLKTPIIVAHDDSEEVKELKESVIAARKELKQRYDAGEDLGEIMRETREQLRELGLYREELEKEVKTIVAERDDLTESDLKDLLGAANKMLEERGVKPIHLDAAFAHHIRTKYMEAHNESND